MKCFISRMAQDLLRIASESCVKLDECQLFSLEDLRINKTKSVGLGLMSFSLNILFALLAETSENCQLPTAKGSCLASQTKQTLLGLKRYIFRSLQRRL